MRSRAVVGRWVAPPLWISTVVVMVWLLFSYLLPQDLSRNTPVYARLVAVAFFGRVLTFHLGLLLAVIALTALPLRRWWLALLAGAVGIGAIAPDLSMAFPRQPVPGAPLLRVMSMNLKYTTARGDLIVDQIHRRNPDVLLLQDCTPFARQCIDAAFPGDYPHHYIVMNTLQGLAIYSRRPFTGVRPRAIFSRTRRQLRATIDCNGQPIVIYIEHPYSPRTVARIMNNRLATLDLARQVAAENDPVIVAGDFNFTSDTPNEDQLITAGLTDAFDVAGHGRGSTWPVHPRWLAWIPGFRIDHVFVSNRLTCTNFAVGEYDGSDHLPVVADVVLKAGGR